MTERIQTPLAKARGLGSAKRGVHHWWMQRVTAVALVPLSLWFVTAAITTLNYDHLAFTLWLKDPVNAILSLLFILAMMYHATLGLQVIIEDYVHCKVVEISMMLGMKFTMIVMAVAAGFSVLRIAFGV